MDDETVFNIPYIHICVSNDLIYNIGTHTYVKEMNKKR